MRLQRGPDRAGGYTPPEPYPDWPDPVYAYVWADEGGSLSAPDGARLDIPAGALSEDTYIALASSRRVPGLGIAEYRLEPEGLTFNKPATLTVPYGGLYSGLMPEEIGFRGMLRGGEPRAYFECPRHVRVC